MKKRTDNMSPEMKIEFEKDMQNFWDNLIEELEKESEIIEEKRKMVSSPEYKEWFLNYLSKKRRNYLLGKWSY